MKRAVRYASVILAISLVYLAWVMVSRYVANRRLMEREKGSGATAFQALPPELSGSELKILQFYAVPSELKRGEKGTLCYSVLNAKTVQLKPAVDSVWPALNRCFEIAPREDTRYILIAKGVDGRVVSESFLLRVKR